MGSTLTAIGSYTPEKVLSNEYFESIVETSNDWIVQRTGIKERRAVSNETTLTMAKQAVLALSKRYNKDIQDVDFILFASSTAEHKIPSLSSQLQAELRISNAGAFDLAAACAGFAYGIIMAQSLISAGVCKKILIVASEVLTRYTDYTDRSTCILFGDSAAAGLLEADPDAKNYLPVFGTEGQYGSALYLSEFATELNNISIRNNNKIVQDGRKVFKWAVERMSRKFNELLELNDLSINEIDYFVPHSANLRIIESICTNVEFDKTKTLNSVEMFGNTSAVTIPLAIDLAIKDNRLAKGHKLLLLGFGGGLTYAGTIIEWDI